MASMAPSDGALTVLVKKGAGSGMAVIFLLIGVVGLVLSLLTLRHHTFHKLGEGQSSARAVTPLCPSQHRHKSIAADPAAP